MNSLDGLVQAVKNAPVEQDDWMTLRCADASQLGGQLDAESLDIREICNHSKIKIAQCQLGCFK